MLYLVSNSINCFHVPMSYFMHGLITTWSMLVDHCYYCTITFSSKSSHFNTLHYTHPLISVHSPTHICTLIHSYLYTHTLISVHSSTHICTLTHSIHSRTHICTLIHSYVYTHTLISVHSPTHICTSSYPLISVLALTHSYLY